MLRSRLRHLIPSADDGRTARSTLGPDHPVARAVTLEHTLARQALVVSGVLAVSIAGWTLGLRIAGVLLIVAALVGACVIAAWAFVRRVGRDRVQELIAAGGEHIALPVVTRERHRLASCKEREVLARSLERSLRDAQRWHELHPLWRPLAGVRCLRDSAPEVRRLIGRLRDEPVRAQGVAVLARLLTDGHTSPLYAGNSRRLREELNRIGYLL